jgi:DNA-binding transcriptional LysR family regulator
MSMFEGVAHAVGRRLALRVAIREAGSLSQAAARLGTPHHNIEHRAAAEQRFDALLFDRRCYRPQLTRR